MHKRKGVLASSLALFPLKLCIFFAFFCPFSAFLTFFNLFLPLSHPSLSFSIPFPPSLILSASYLCFIPLLPFIYLLYPFCSFWLLLFLSLFIPLIYLCVFPFILPLSLLMPSMLSGFVFPLLTSIYSYSVVVIILLMCLSLYSLLPECLDALPHVPEVLYHL